MLIAIAVETWKGVEEILIYKDRGPFNSGNHNFEEACTVAEERADEFDGEHTDYNQGKLKCRVYPLKDGEIHIEEVEV